MAAFLTDTTENLALKEDLNALTPAELLQPQKYFTADDHNKIRTYLQDIRTELRTPVFNVKHRWTVAQGGTDAAPATGDGTTDDIAGIQSATNAAIAASSGWGGGAIVYYPPGNYRISKSVKTLGGSRVLHWGAGLNVTLVTPLTTARGPSHYFVPSRPIFPTAAGPFGTGAALDLATATGAGGAALLYLNMRHQPRSWLHGQTQLNVSFWFKSSRNSPTVSTLALFGSRAQEFADGPAANRGFQALADVNNQFSFWLTTTAGEFGLGTGLNSWVKDTWCHVEYDWNGTTVKIFVDGVQKNSFAVGGSIVMKTFEEFCIGRISGGYMGGVHQINGGDMIYSLRVSNISRHQSAFTPPTSANTLVDSFVLYLINGDKVEPGLVGADFPGGTAWIPVQGGGGNISRHGVGNMTIQNCGIFAQGVNQFQVQNVRFNGVHYGVWLHDNCYESRISNIEVITGEVDTNFKPLFGLALTQTSGLTQVSSATITSGTDGIAVVNSSINVNSSFCLAARSPLHVSDRSLGGGVSNFVEFVTTDEDQPVAHDQLVGLDTNNGVNFYGCSFELSTTPNNGKPLFRLSGDVGPVSLYGCNFRPGDATSCVFHHYNSTHNHKVRVHGRSRWNETTAVQNIPWANTTGVVFMPDIWSGKATIADTNTFVDITLPAREAAADYAITLGTPGVTVGTPASGSTRAYWSNRTATAFRINVEVAPGTGNTVEIPWSIGRQ